MVATTPEFEGHFSVQAPVSTGFYRATE